MSNQGRIFPLGFPRGDEGSSGQGGSSKNILANFICSLNKRINNFFYFSRRRRKPRETKQQSSNFPEQKERFKQLNQKIEEKEALIAFQRLQLAELASKLDLERRLHIDETATSNKKRKKLDENRVVKSSSQSDAKTKTRTRLSIKRTLINPQTQIKNKDDIRDENQTNQDLTHENEVLKAQIIDLEKRYDTLKTQIEKMMKSEQVDYEGDKTTIIKKIMMEVPDNQENLCSSYINQNNFRFDFHILEDQKRNVKIFRSNFCDDVVGGVLMESKTHLKSCRDFAARKDVYIDQTFNLDMYKSDKKDLEKRIKFLEKQGFHKVDLMDSSSDDSDFNPTRKTQNKKKTKKQSTKKKSAKNRG